MYRICRPPGAVCANGAFYHGVWTDDDVWADGALRADGALGADGA